MELLISDENSYIRNNLDSLLLDEQINSDEICSICYRKKNNPIELKCKHSFCYDCLVESFRGVKCNFHCKTHRVCPYCRKQSSFLPLLEGNKPIKGIHKEYGKKIVKKGVKCCAILKSGKNKGLQCSCYALGNSQFCGRHNKCCQNDKDLKSNE